MVFIYRILLVNTTEFHNPHLPNGVNSRTPRFRSELEERLTEIPWVWPIRRDGTAETFGSQLRNPRYIRNLRPASSCNSLLSNLFVKRPIEACFLFVMLPLLSLGSHNGEGRAEICSPALSKPSRKQVSRACDHCRSRRVKCDHGKPCRPCRQKGLQCNSRGRFNDEARTLPQALQ